MNSVARLAAKISKLALGVLGLEPDDVILASFPRSGSTWVRFFWCSLLSLEKFNGREADFYLVNSLMPEFGTDDLTRPWPGETLPRLVKTHWRRSLIFRQQRAILLLRDPKDVMISYYIYETSRRAPRFEGSLAKFMRSKEFGVRAWLEHATSWETDNSVTLYYEDLLNDPLEGFESVLKELSIPYTSDDLRWAVEHTSASRLKTTEATTGFRQQREFQPGFRFVRSGTAGQWRDELENEDIEFINSILERAPRNSPARRYLEG